MRLLITKQSRRWHLFCMGNACILGIFASTHFHLMLEKLTDLPVGILNIVAGALWGKFCIDLYYFDLIRTVEYLEEQDRRTIHKHKCNHCGHEWEHTGAQGESIRAHMCSKCKSLQFKRWKPR